MEKQEALHHTQVNISSETSLIQPPHDTQTLVSPLNDAACVYGTRQVTGNVQSPVFDCRPRVHSFSRLPGCESQKY